ncbi:MAG: hypothetical protein L0Z62_50645 [Gemmataceae bacterium]|nr:hypothetical protein [Gemmataceae bacterium]
MKDVAEMLPLYEDPWFTFRFTDDRLIPRFHLEGVEAGRSVSVFKIDPDTGERLALLATAIVGEYWLAAGDVSPFEIGTRLNTIPMSALKRDGSNYGFPREAFEELVDQL